MRTLAAGLAVCVAGVAGGAATLAVGSSAQWVVFELPSLNRFVRLTNQTIAFVNERVASDPIAHLPEIRHGAGLRLTESLGTTLRVGLQVVVASAGVRTQGAWTQGETDHSVDIALDAGLVAFLGEVALALVPDLLMVSVSAGWGAFRVSYRCVFPQTLPTDWSLPFLPKAEDTPYTGSGPLGAIAVQLSLPVGRGESVGAEAGFRFASPRVLISGTSVLDLNADGLGDPIRFSGLWLGLTVRMEFNLWGGVR